MASLNDLGAREAGYGIPLADCEEDDGARATGRGRVA